MPVWVVFLCNLWATHLGAGHGAFGKLGHGDTRDRGTPALVAALAHEAVTSVSLGSAYSGAVTRDGTVYTWGACALSCE